jgi:hypothetical protein
MMEYSRSYSRIFAQMTRSRKFRSHVTLSLVGRLGGQPLKIPKDVRNSVEIHANPSGVEVRPEDMFQSSSYYLLTNPAVLQGTGQCSTWPKALICQDRSQLTVLFLTGPSATRLLGYDCLHDLSDNRRYTIGHHGACSSPSDSTRVTSIFLLEAASICTPASGRA